MLKDLNRESFIDMEYILENVPEYTKHRAPKHKVTKWREELDQLVRYIEQLKTDLTNERAILTQDLIEEKEDQITLKQQELRRLESLFLDKKENVFIKKATSKTRTGSSL